MAKQEAETVEVTLARIEERLNALIEKINEKPYCAKHDQIFSGLDERIKKVEAFKSWMGGAIAISNVVTAFVTSVIIKIFGK